jgi:mono/diheme cytochrome c family protein
MNRGRINRTLGVALVATVALNIAYSGARTRPNFEYLTNMARTDRFNAFEENPNFSDGQTLRAPVSGTIPRGWLPVGDTNPFSADDRAATDRGAVVFTNFCQPCHGANAQGQGPVVLRGFPPPPPLTRGQTQDKSDAELYEVVTKGVITMPSYASQLSPEDRWKVILYVRSLRRR